jgi:hypothetical protein
MNLHWIWRSFLVLYCGLVILLPVSGDRQSFQYAPSVLPVVQTLKCEQPGWDPSGFGLKDHAVFTFDGYYYIVSIQLPGEAAFAYARSADLCNWEDLGPILKTRITGEWDESMVWAPSVWEENGVFYMYYTGVRHDFTQSIMLATSINPADPGSWQRQGMIFHPDHVGAVWKAGRWADCRDASIVKIEQLYYMFYTGSDAAGPIIGWASSISPVGPWHDMGATLTLAHSDTMAESPTIFSRAGIYFLIYHNTTRGQEYRVGFSLTGPWSKAYPLPPGWANEIWVGQDGLDYTSYVKNYAIVINRLKVNTSPSDGAQSTSPSLFVEPVFHQLFFPLMVNQ